MIALVSAGVAIWRYQERWTSRRAFLWAWLFGLGKYAVGTSWIYVSIHVHGQATIPLALSLVAIFVAGMAFFPAFPGGCWFRGRTGRPLIDVMSFSPFGHLVNGCLRGFFFPGFPGYL
ncbi:MAG: hypothetical protein Ct9H300mP8_00140 [Gammaproteobacteria bacterium]|nr:MAG: hypothetical protein Ct9H300mP8_00140 [Gammaproteobacteria bacterium]